MSLVFSYQPSVGRGGVSRLRPYVPIRASGPAGARRFARALVDSGSDDTLLPIAVANKLGISLRDFKAGQQQSGKRSIVTWRGVTYDLKFAEVELEVSDGAAILQWSAEVGFTDAPLPTPLLGESSFFEFFDVTFIAADQRLVLEPNANAFPGTVL